MSRAGAVMSASPVRSGHPPSAVGLRGDEADLFARHHRAVLAHVRRMAGGAPEALVEDACVFAWIQLLRRQPERDNVRAWLCTVARREAWRLSGELRQLLSLDEPVVVDAASGREEAGAVIDCVEARDTVEAAHRARDALRALAALPKRQRRYLELRVAGFSYSEICGLTGTSYTSVNKQLTRARARVKDATVA